MNILLSYVNSNGIKSRCPGLRRQRGLDDPLGLMLRIFDFFTALGRVNVLKVCFDTLIISLSHSVFFIRIIFCDLLFHAVQESHHILINFNRNVQTEEKPD